MTEPASTKNKKQKNTSNPSAPSDININGNIEPIKWDPTSPIIILAGFVFHHRNPKQAPDTDEIKSEISTVKNESPTNFE